MLIRFHFGFSFIFSVLILVLVIRNVRHFIPLDKKAQLRHVNTYTQTKRISQVVFELKIIYKTTC